MRRVLVVGMSGAGKTTAARRLADRIGAPFHEMDALAWGPGWTTPPDFAATVDALLDAPRWVFDSWGYEQVRESMWAATDTVIWLDYPARIVLGRLARRSLGRTLRRTEIFGGNRELLAAWFTADHPLWYAVRRFRDRRRTISGLVASAGHVRTVRLRRPAEFDTWLRTVPPA